MSNMTWSGGSYAEFPITGNTTITGYGTVGELDVYSGTGVFDGTFSISVVVNEAGLVLQGLNTVGFIETFGSLAISGSLDAIGDLASTYHGIFLYQGTVQIEPGATVNASEFLVLYSSDDLNIAGTLDIETPAYVDATNHVIGGLNIESNSFVYLQAGGSLQTTYLSLESAYALLEIDNAGATVTQTGTDPTTPAGIQLEAGTLEVINGATLNTTFLGQSGINQTSPSNSLFVVDNATVDISAPAGDINGFIITDGSALIEDHAVVTASQVIVKPPSSNADPSVPGLTISGSTLSVTGGMALAYGTTRIINSATVLVAGDLVLDSPATAPGYYATYLAVDSFSTLDVSGKLYLGASAGAGVELYIDNTGRVDIGGSGTFSGVGILAVGGLIAGHGLIAAAQTGSVAVGNTPQPIYGLLIDDEGTIDATTGTLIIDGTITGAGSIQIEAGSTLELAGGLAASVAVNLTGTGQHTLILDNLAAVAGRITGLSVGDQVILRNTSIANADGVVAATLGTFDGRQLLAINETPNYQNVGQYAPTFIPVTGTFIGDYVQVTQSANGADTVLTIAQGNPIDMSIGGAAAATEYPGITGAGIVVGIISDSFNDLNGLAYDQSIGALPYDVTIINDVAGGTDEGRAMAEIVHDIAPGASIRFYGVATAGDMAGAINALAYASCNVIVDDLGFSAAFDVVGGPIDAAIDAAVAGGITYVTAGGNDRQKNPTPLPIFGHSANPNALTVAAMNILATPSTIGGYITPPLTDPFSSLGTVDSKPDITGPDGGATTLPLLAYNSYGTLEQDLSPFFGTSAAAPAVAAVAALMLQEKPALQHLPLEVDQLLRQSATAFAEPPYAMGAGLVEIPAALALAASAACYAAGTRIATPEGDRPVEELRAGDSVITIDGAAKPIIWIGRRRLRPMCHPHPERLHPIRIRAAAFGSGLPARDLYVSPEHALFVFGVLIPARCLVNGTSIMQVERQEIVYYHIELAQHDILLAEKLPAESWLDTGSRSAFDNAPVVSLTVDFGPGAAGQAWENLACAPLREMGPVVDKVRAMLTQRALRLGFRSYEMPVMIDIATQIDLVVPATVGRIIIRSPVQHGIGADRRVLGCAISDLSVDDVAVPMEHACLTSGFYDVEHDASGAWRWTNGEARIALGESAAPRRLTLNVIAVARAAQAA